jgi:hypothetical protein
VRRLLVRTAVAAVFISLAVAGLPAASVVETPNARLVSAARPDPDFVVGAIKRYKRATWRWQRLMGVSRTPTRRRYLRTRDREFLVYVAHQWRRRAIRARVRAHNPPHEWQWRCLQRHEGPWRDAADPYWGGLQMGRSFMLAHAPRHLLRRGWAHRWSPIEQMWVAERAFRAGRGFYPWPNTARTCGLI